MTSVTKPDSSHPTGETAVYLFDNWFDPIEGGVRDRVREFIHAMIEGELDMALSRPRYARHAKSVITKLILLILSRVALSGETCRAPSAGTKSAWLIDRFRGDCRKSKPQGRSRWTLPLLSSER
jgi:hypothetical protein